MPFIINRKLLSDVGFVIHNTAKSQALSTPCHQDASFKQYVEVSLLLVSVLLS